MFVISLTTEFVTDHLENLGDPMYTAEGYSEEGMKEAYSLIRQFFDELRRINDTFAELNENNILIRTISKDLLSLNEGLKIGKVDFDDAELYLGLKSNCSPEKLDSIFLEMNDYQFHACFPNEESQIITQGYWKGEYNTGYFSNSPKSKYVEPAHIKLDIYHKAAEILTK